MHPTPQNNFKLNVKANGPAPAPFPAATRNLSRLYNYKFLALATTRRALSSAGQTRADQGRKSRQSRQVRQGKAWHGKSDQG